ncbi:crotonase/enoyl-CoA hydratase family protein [Novosphingobium pentaromativorans]|nr:crotonase/enoyl-CoA hydratase family protein [Novosphingobium pentaromativorans]AIT81441.1 enoyl-CoA hydratase [Novosphingobium pentaromativorans US6-1]
MSDTENLVVTESMGDGVLLVTINRPDQRNAINGAVARAMDAIVSETEVDDSVRVVVLTGAGDKVFCAGADLKEVAAGRIDTLRTPGGGFAGFVQRKRTKPWIAAVQGFALAGGCEIALACDLIVASRSSVFGLPEVARGLIAGAGGLFRLPSAIPKKIALELILTASRLPAERAADLGLVNRLADDGAAVEQAIALAREITVNAPLPIKACLEIVSKVGEASEDALWKMSREAMDRIKQSEDAIEGATAFAEKRDPVWKGR